MDKHQHSQTFLSHNDKWSVTTDVYMKFSTVRNYKPADAYINCPFVCREMNESEMKFGPSLRDNVRMQSPKQFIVCDSSK
jgi:hypothetical protein